MGIVRVAQAFCQAKIFIPMRVELCDVRAALF